LMTLASFRISVESPSNLRFLPEGLYSINMLVVPMWGLYANMIAQLLSQLSSHVIIHYHRKTIIAAAIEDLDETEVITGSEEIEDLGVTEKLCARHFKLEYEASTDYAAVRKGVNWVFVASSVSLVILVVVGCSLASFAIDVLGLVGLAMESGNQFEQATVFYSVFDLASMITEQGRFLGTTSDLVGLGSFASLLVITVFLVPLAQAASLLAQWFAPMTKKQRAQNTLVNEVLSSWQYMEVYVLSIIIAAWQLGDVSEIMINAYCDELKDAFQSLAQFGIISSDDAQCFRVNAQVDAAAWLLVAASLILYVLNHFVGAASVQKTLDGDTSAGRRRHPDNWPQSVEAVVDKDDEQESNTSDKEVIVSPIPPRFTDYYHFATLHHTEEEYNESEAVETAVAPAIVNFSGE